MTMGDGPSAVVGVSGAETGIGRLAWVDWCRLVAAGSIFLFHFVFDYVILFGAPRAAQATLGISGALVRADMWGISLFVVLMGASSELARRRRGYVRQVFRRLLRILLPLWLLAIPYVVAGLVVHEMSPADLWKVPFWLFGLNVVSPAVFWPVSQAWWYVTLAAQWALVGPLAQRLWDKVGAVWFTLACALLQVVSLVFVRQLPHEWAYLSRGFIGARAVELALGFTLVAVLRTGTGEQDRLRQAVAMLVIATAAWFSVDLGANTTAWWLLSYVFIAAMFSLRTAGGTSGRVLSRAAALTYPFYLVHAPIQKYFQAIAARLGVSAFWALLIGAFVLSCAVAVALQAAIRYVERHARVLAGLWRTSEVEAAKV